MKTSNNLSVFVIPGLLVSMVLGQNNQVPDSIPHSGFQESPMNTGSVNVTTREAFLRTLIAAKLPGGIVWQQNCRGAEARPQSALTISSLREALDSIMRADPQYRWYQDEGGVINLSPAFGEPDLLKAHIREYRLRNVSHVNLALEQLLALPEVRKRTAELHLHQGLKFGGLSTPNPRQSQLKVSLRDVTLRQALNAIVRAHGRAVWEYSERRCSGNNTFTIDFVAQ